jgi:hypothetical protein
MQMDLDIWQLNFGCSWCLQQQIILLRDKPWLHACMHSQVVSFMLLYCRSLIEVRSGKSFIDIIVEHIEVQILYKSFLVFLPLVVNVTLCLWIVGSQSFAFEKAFGFLKEHPHGFEDWKPWLGACFQMFWIQTAFDLIKKTDIKLDKIMATGNLQVLNFRYGTNILLILATSDNTDEPLSQVWSNLHCNLKRHLLLGSY